MNRQPIISQLTLRSPKTLHQQLATLAKNEGLSVNQYIVDDWTRQATLYFIIWLFGLYPNQLNIET